MDLFQPAPAGEKGAALLIFMIIIVQGISTVLLERARTGTATQRLDTETAAALAEAKAALIGWSIGHPAATSGFPGVMPFPDRNGEVSPNDGNSDCVANGLNYGHLYK